jgi:hypothetical protein
VKNPFIYGKVVKGKYFADREKEIETLTKELSRGQNVILFSPRRYGKTSLILNVFDTLREKGFPTIYIDFYPVTTREKLVGIYAKAVSSALTGSLERILGELKELFTRIVPKISIGAAGGPEIEYEIRVEKDNIEKALEETLQAPQKIASKRKKRVVVALDEFQEIDNLQGKSEIERMIRTCIQHHDMVSYAFLGSKRHLMDKMFHDKNRPLYRIGTHIPLEEMPFESFREFIENHFRSGGFEAEKKVVEEILRISDGHPYYTQMLCSILWETKIDKKKISLEDVELALREALGREEHAYITLWDSLTIKQKRFIEGLCTEKSIKPFSGKFIESHRLGSPATIQRVVKRLSEDGTIEREDDTYCVADVFFKEWVIRKIRG